MEAALRESGEEQQPEVENTQPESPDSELPALVPSDGDDDVADELKALPTEPEDGTETANQAESELPSGKSVTTTRDRW